MRPVAEIRVGIIKITEKWKTRLPADYSFLTESYLSKKFPSHFEGLNYYVHGGVSPDDAFITAVKSLSENQSIEKDGMLLAFCSSAKFTTPEELLEASQMGNKLTWENDVAIFNKNWEIFKKNGAELNKDYQLITKGRKSEPITDPHTIVYNPENIFVEEGASIKAAVLNAENGPIYIGKNAEIHEGALVRGALALCENSHINMGAKIRGDNTFGPFSKVGGEVANSVIFGYSNKSHDGYLGNSVIAEWCNFGADSNTSNLKNNYSNVKNWDYSVDGFVDTGLQFCGLMMGDHAKSGINTMFNTGTVVGVGAILYGAGFLKNFIPSFGWGGEGKVATFRLPKMYELAGRVLARRGLELTEEDKNILAHVYEITEKYRS